MNHVTSKNGTRIAFDQTGQGPPVILVGGALSYRKFAQNVELAELLAPHFTVLNYDRRGRGDSTDTLPYSVDREVEDIAALVEHAGGKAALFGLSSGAALALLAAARGVPLTKLAIFEPPYVAVDKTERQAPADHEAQMQRLVAKGDRGGAIRFFMVDIVGVPSIFFWILRLMPLYAKFRDVAHTLPYDLAIMRDFELPAAEARAIGVPTLVLSGDKSPSALQKAARATAAAIPGAGLAMLEGQSHNASMKVLAPELIAFLK